MKRIAVGSIVIFLLYLLSVRFNFFLVKSLLDLHINRELVTFIGLLLFSAWPIIVLGAAADKLGEIILAKLNPNQEQKHDTRANKRII